MFDAVVGAVIMVVATTSMLYSIGAERAFDQAGRYPRMLMKRVLRPVGVSMRLSRSFWQDNIRCAS